MKGVRSFLGHTEFYRRFIKDFSQITKPLCKFFIKDTRFEFSDECLHDFETLKKKLNTLEILGVDIDGESQADIIL